MPRNASGVYSLPVAAYVAGTTIVSADMNSNLSDIGTALTQSLASTGVTPMTGPIKLAAGTLGAPSLTLASDTTTGWYNNAAGAMTYVSAGVAIFGLSGSGASLVGSLTVSTSLQVGTSLIVGTTTAMGGVLTIAVASNTAVFRNTTNNTSENIITTYQQGSGAGNAVTVRAVGGGANDITVILHYIGTDFIWAYSNTSFFMNRPIDFQEAAAPSAPAANIARLYAVDDGAGNTILSYISSTHTVRLPAIGSVITEAFNSNALNASLTGAIPVDDTIPQIGEGDAIVSQAITIKYATSKIRVRAQGTVFIGNAGSVSFVAAIFDGSANAVATTTIVPDPADSGSATLRPFFLEWEYTAPSAGAVTYSLRTGVSAGAYRFNGTGSRLYGGSMHVTLSIQEIAQ